MRFLLLILTFRTVRTQIPSSERWLFGQWAASVWTRSRSTCVSHWGNVWRTRTRTWERRPPSVWLNFTTSTPKWWRTRASWIPCGISLQIQTLWCVLILFNISRVEDDERLFPTVFPSKRHLPPSLVTCRLWPTLSLLYLRSVSLTPTATCWTSIPRTSTSC